MATTAARPAARRPTPPGIDGEVHIRDAGHLAPGDIVRVLVEEADEHDLFGVPLA